MLTAAISREQSVRDAKRPRFDRDVRAVACSVMEIPFGPVRVGAGCFGEADGEDIKGNPTVWDATANCDAIVPWFMRS